MRDETANQSDKGDSKWEEPTVCNKHIHPLNRLQ